MSARHIIRRLATIIMVIGVAMLAYVGFVFVDAWMYRMDYHRAESVAVAHAATRAPVPRVDGAAIGEIHIKRLGLSEVIGEGESATVLRHGVGHLPDTAWLGQAGNIALAGHRDTVFRALRDIRIGDRIDLTTRDRHARYEVQSATVVSPADLEALAPSGGNTLTLITCYPFSFIGPAPNRFIVRATEVGPDGAPPASDEAPRT